MAPRARRTPANTSITEAASVRALEAEQAAATYEAAKPEHWSTGLEDTITAIMAPPDELVITSPGTVAQPLDVITAPDWDDAADWPPGDGLEALTDTNDTIIPGTEYAFVGDATDRDPTDRDPTEAEDLRHWLLTGRQPDDIEGYVYQAVGAAGRHAPYGPGITEVFRDDLARVIAEWAFNGIRNLIAARPFTANVSVGIPAESVNVDGQPLHNGPVLDQLAAEHRASVDQ